MEWVQQSAVPAPAFLPATMLACPRCLLPPPSSSPSTHLFQLVEQFQQLRLICLLVAGPAAARALPHDVADVLAQPRHHPPAMALDACCHGRLGIGHGIKAHHQGDHILQRALRCARGGGAAHRGQCGEEPCSVRVMSGKWRTMAGLSCLLWAA